MENVSIISSAQLERIRQEVLEKTVDTNTEERRRLKQLSDQRTAKWPNTLQAAREKKEQARQEELAVEEAKRELEDKQAADIKLVERRTQIERANKMLFDSADRTKALHSKMHLGEVMRENEALIGYKRQITQLKAEQEQQFLQQQQRALEIAEQAEMQKLEEERARALAQRDVQFQQLDELRERIRQERRVNRQEGEMVRQKALEEAEELRKKDAAWRATAKHMNEQTKRANEILNDFKAKEKERDKLAEDAIQAYSIRKAQQVLERQRGEAEKKAAKEAERLRMVNLMEANYMTWHAKQEEKLEAEVQKAEQKAEAELSERERRRRAEMLSMHTTNQAQLAAKKEAKAKQQLDERTFADAWTVRLAELHAEEQSEAKDRREACRKVEEFQKWQANLKRQRKASAHLTEMQEALMTQLNVQEQDEAFTEYATARLGEWTQSGKPVQPMQLYLTKKKPDIREAF